MNLKAQFPVVLIWTGALAVGVSLAVDILLGRSPFEGVIGVFGILLACLGGWRLRREALVLNDRSRLRTGEGIAVLAGIGAVQESFRQFLYNGLSIQGLSIQLDYVGTFELMVV